nr:MAG TPA: RecQ-mediated genome instability protein 1 [Caudoviricetes sp.]
MCYYTNVLFSVNFVLGLLGRHIYMGVVTFFVS